VKVPGSPNIKSEFVKTGLFVISGEGSNSVLRLSANGLILIDDKLPGNYEGLVGRAQKISDQPVRFLILTDVSKSNTGNLAQFVSKGTRIVAQESIAQALLSEKLVDPDHAAAIIRFEHDHTIHLGSIEAQVLYYGNAHAAGDTVVYFPNLKAVAVGNLYSSNPELAAGGNLANWSSVLEQVLKLDFDTVIPAVGTPVTKVDLQAFKSKMNSLVSRANTLVKQGVPKDQFIAQLKAEDFGWHLSLTPDQINSLYAELSSKEAANR
jgi:glyoxylase-like metal-dependent hydrolase (beta-lactamase superfamily II)